MKLVGHVDRKWFMGVKLGADKEVLEIFPFPLKRNSDLERAEGQGFEVVKPLQIQGFIRPIEANDMLELENNQQFHTTPLGMRDLLCYIMEGVVQPSSRGFYGTYDFAIGSVFGRLRIRPVKPKK